MSTLLNLIVAERTGFKVDGTNGEHREPPEVAALAGRLVDEAADALRSDAAAIGTDTFRDASHS